MNAVTKLSESGDIAIPARLRAAHGWQAGTHFEVIDRPDGVFLRAEATDNRPRLTLAAFHELIPPHLGPQLSIEEMDAAVARLAGE